MDKSNSCVTFVKTYNKQLATKINSHVLDNYSKQYIKYTLHYFVSSKSTDANVEMMDTDNDHISARNVKVDTKHIQLTVERRKEDANHNPQV